MARTDANPPMPEWSDEYQLVEVDADYLAKAVKPKQFIHIDQSECIMCEGCVDICPWKCIHMVTPDAIAEASTPSSPARTRGPRAVHHRRRRLHALRALRRPLPDGRDHHGQGPGSRRRPATATPAPTTTAMPTACGSEREETSGQDLRRPPEALHQGAADQGGDSVQGSQAVELDLPAGLHLPKGYTDSPRNRSYVVMNSVLYHLHPVKVKRHAVKVSYTLCLGGLSFFLFILLTVTASS
jgi:ferredoxin